MSKIRTAFVLGAGLGTRLRPLTDALPKPLLPVRGRPLIERIFDSLIGCGVENFIVNTHHLAEKYAQKFPSAEYRGRPIRFVHEPLLLDTGGGVKNILGFWNPSEPLLVHNGDILFDAPLKPFMRAAQNSHEGALLCLRSSGGNMNVSVKGERVVDLRFADGAPFDKKAQFTGVFAALPGFLDACASFGADKFSSVDAFLKMLSRGERLGAFFEDAGSWSDIGTMEEYAKWKQ